MIIGVPREIKPGEQRVALTPAGARELVEAAHAVLVERGAGEGSGIRDDEYATVGAELVSVDDVWRRSELVLKVKEPLAPEVARLRPGQLLFTYLHLAPAPGSRAGSATGRDRDRLRTVPAPTGLPLLTPMSEVAGRLSVQEGAYYLGRAHGGRGILLSGVPGVPPGNVVIIGAGAAGLNALKTAVGLGADVSILDVNLDRLRHVDDLFRGQVVTLMSNSFNIERAVRRADLLVAPCYCGRAGAGSRHQRDGVADEGSSVIVDIAVDQGGCVATIHRARSIPSMVGGVVHYGVAGMPFVRALDLRLTNATRPYVVGGRAAWWRRCAIPRWPRA
jgi:alanine dehydrogenase